MIKAHVTLTNTSSLVKLLSVLFILITGTESYAQELSFIKSAHHWQELDSLKIDDFNFNSEATTLLLKSYNFNTEGWRIDGIIPSSIQMVLIPNVNPNVRLIQYYGHAYGDEISYRLFVQNSDSSFTLPLAAFGGDSDSYYISSEFNESKNEWVTTEIRQSLFIENFNMSLYRFDTIVTTYAYDREFNLKSISQHTGTYIPQTIKAVPFHFTEACSHLDSLYAVSKWRELASECIGNQYSPQTSNEELLQLLLPNSNYCAKLLLDTLLCTIMPVEYSNGYTSYATEISEIVLYSGLDTVYDGYFDSNSHKKLHSHHIPSLISTEFSLSRQYEFVDGFHYILSDYIHSTFRELSIRNDSLILHQFSRKKKGDNAVLQEFTSLLEKTEERSELLTIRLIDIPSLDRSDSIQLTKALYKAIVQQLDFADSNLSMTSLLSIGLAFGETMTVKVRGTQVGRFVELCFTNEYTKASEGSGTQCFYSFISNQEAQISLSNSVSPQIDTLFEISTVEWVLIHGRAGGWYDTSSYFNISFQKLDEIPTRELIWNSTMFPAGFNVELMDESILCFTLPYKFNQRTVSFSKEEGSLYISAFPNPEYYRPNQKTPITFKVLIETDFIRVEKVISD